MMESSSSEEEKKKVDAKEEPKVVEETMRVVESTTTVISAPEPVPTPSAVRAERQLSSSSSSSSLSSSSSESEEGVKAKDEVATQGPIVATQEHQHHDEAPQHPTPSELVVADPVDHHHGTESAASSAISVSTTVAVSPVESVSPRHYFQSLEAAKARYELRKTEKKICLVT
jgi:hypothetical protein